MLLIVQMLPQPADGGSRLGSSSFRSLGLIGHLAGLILVYNALRSRVRLDAAQIVAAGAREMERRRPAIGRRRADAESSADSCSMVAPGMVGEPSGCSRSQKNLRLERVSSSRWTFLGTETPSTRSNLSDVSTAAARWWTGGRAWTPPPCSRSGPGFFSSFSARHDQTA